MLLKSIILASLSPARRGIPLYEQALGLQCEHIEEVASQSAHGFLQGRRGAY